MQKEALSCFTAQLRGVLLCKTKNQMARSAVKMSPRSSTFHLFLQGFLAAALPVRKHKVKQPYEKHESGLLK